MQVKPLIKKTLKELDKYLPHPLFYSLVMSKPERKLLHKSIKDARNYLEFGMGGSTFRVLQKSNAKVYTIDSSEAWLAHMRSFSFIRKMERKRLFLYLIDIGPTGDWGYPVGDSYKSSYPQYSSEIFELIDKELIDTVLIDGRFRVACTLKTILECYNNAGLKILIHDFYDREEYHIVLKYLHELEKADTLGVFSIKKGIDLAEVQADYEAYQYIPN